ncbi:MAG: hypothetical protein QXS20_01380 [Candidatus Thorarchaeota archaeon]
MVRLVFRCPECKVSAVLEIEDDEAQRILSRIQKEGRSPPLIVKCENGHEILVTVSTVPSGKGLCIRDVAVPQRKETGKKDDEWLMKAFGGEDL